MKRVLVTGASGFIGAQSLPTLLENNCEVHGVSLHEPKADMKVQKGVTWHRADLLDPEARNTLIASVQPSHILHFAWIATPGEYWTSPLNEQWKNATIDLLRIAKMYDVERFVGAGTCAEYDWSAGECDEITTPLKPSSPYGEAKAACGIHVNQDGGMVSTAWGRVFHLYGPSEHPQRFVASIIQSLLANEPAECTHGNQIRSFLHVRDAADAFVSVLLNDVKGPINIASKEATTLRNIAEEIARQMKKEHLLRMGAREAPANDPPILIARCSRLYDEVGWQPTFSLESGIANTIEWWKSQE